MISPRSSGRCGWTSPSESRCFVGICGAATISGCAKRNEAESPLAVGLRLGWQGRSQLSDDGIEAHPATVCFALQAGEHLVGQIKRHWHRFFVVPRLHPGTGKGPPAHAPRLRSIPKHEVQARTAEQLSGFLQAVVGHRLFPASWLPANTGIRRSELLGLRWTDIDLDLTTVEILTAWRT
jgi:hypothetical protein